MPLSLSIKYGHGGVDTIPVDIMDVNPNRVERYNHTQLLWAVWIGHAEVVKIPLERVDI